MMKPIIITLSVLTALLSAKPIPIDPAQFRSKDFINAFTGSYGILSPVEPKVSRDENELLAEVAELFGKGQFRSAESKIVNFIKEKKNPVDGSEPSEVSAALIFVLGNLYFQNDQADQAVRSYKLAIKRFPKFRRAFKNLALLHASKDDYVSALPYLKQAVQLGDSDHRTFGLLGYCYLSENKPLASEGAYRQAYLLNADERDWKLGLAQALLQQEKWTESAALLGELIDESPDNAQLWMQQANCYMGNEQNLRAAGNFEILRLKGLADAQTLTLLGNIYIDQEQPGLALNAYLASLEKQPNPDVSQALETAKILVGFAAYEQAETYLSRIRSLKLNTSQKVREVLVRKEIAEARGEMKEVETLLNTAREISPGNGEVLIALGRFYLDQSKQAETPEAKDKCTSDAKVLFKQCLQKASVRYEANLRYGQLKVSVNEYEDALGFLETANKLQPSDNLTQYIRRVQRAAERAKEKAEAGKS